MTAAAKHQLPDFSTSRRPRNVEAPYATAALFGGWGPRVG